MTKLLEQAIAKLRNLPESDQDAAAEALFVHIATEPQYRLTPGQVREVKRIQRNLRSGKTRLATEKETRALWKKFGL